ncbi:hypothetical protein F5146DRAFT_1165054 [Armillaria mellea]|nr:hypothetical protein F5146DRAFT_1165054 [Armillaria mellea]
MPYTTYPAIRIYTSCTYSPPFDNCTLGIHQPDNQIFIISEYIHNKSKPFPWRLHLSFATDIAHALTYLHTRKCIHRDLKDSYMSPEVLLGDKFDLPTNITFNINGRRDLETCKSGLSSRHDCPLIEVEVLAHPSKDEDAHVGSIKFMTSAKKDIQSSRSSTDDSDDELMEAVTGLSSLGVNSGWSDSTGGGNQPLLNTGSSGYSTMQTVPPSLSSILTIRASPNPNETPDQVLPASNPSPSSRSTIVAQHTEGEDLLGISSIMSIDSLDLYHTAAGVSAISSTLATEGGSMIRSLHGDYPKKNSISGTISPPGEAVTWNPLDLIFSSGLFVAKYDVCMEWLGWKPVLECDDCGLKAHIKCGEVALHDCGLQPSFHDHTTGMSPVSKVKQGGKGSLTR